MLQSVQTSCSNKLFSTLGIFGVAGLTTGMSCAMISWNFMGSRPTIYVKIWDYSADWWIIHRTGLLARNRATGRNAKGTVKGVPFLEGVQQNLYGQILGIVALYICAKFWANRHLHDSQNFFPKISFAAVEAFNNGMPWKVYSTNKWWQTPPKHWLHKWLLHLM